MVKNPIPKYLITEGVELIQNGSTSAAAAKLIHSREDALWSVDYFRQLINRATGWPEYLGMPHASPKKKEKVIAEPKPTKTAKVLEPKPFVLSAWDFEGEGRMMDIDEYCERYGLPRANVINYRLVTHTGTPYYNTSFKEVSAPGSVMDYEAVKAILDAAIKADYVPIIDTNNIQAREGVLKWADLHFGAHIRNLVLSHDYDSNILANGLETSIIEVNALGFKKVHVHIMGDLIESLSGLNHINSWHSMNKDETGANAIMFCCKLIANALKGIVNLGCIKIIGGNHDRLSKDNDEDVKGGCAELIAWGLTLQGFDVEFHPYIICHEVEGINHINLHGDKGISKRKTSDILWKYGNKGSFNFVFEAHLHAIIEKLTVAQREGFKTVTDDAIDHRRMHLPSFFTGNYYSETLGFNSNAGFVIVYDNGKGKPNLFTCSA